ncbi:MAG: PQQ-binding-like beta-propeller repeat protein [Planctomycetes bacterium]|nr:PQQ-binding-like beta-propeller repeat protein [Planctomycetota bacterium]
MTRILAACALLVCCAVAGADDWPAWRGPTGQGYCFEKNVPMKWSATENVKWKIKLDHPGYSTPIVWKEKIFVTLATPDGSVRSLYCLDRADGKQLWKKDVPHNEKEMTWQGTYPYAHASPTTDGERVVVSFGSAGMHCYDLTGKELWKRTDLGSWQHSFGNSSSPVLYEDLCILYCGPNSNKGRNYIIAVNKTTGKTVWEAPFKSAGMAKAGFFWGTPTIVKVEGKDQMLACGDYTFKGFDPKTGKELWHCDGLMEYIYTSPLYSPKHNIAVAMSGFSKSALAVKLGGSGDITKDRLWHHPQNNQRVGSGIIVGDHVYILEDNGTPKCLEIESGKQVWEADKRSFSTNWGSMVHVDGKLYCMMRNGDTAIFAASPKYQVLALNRLSKGEFTNSSPAISNGEIFLRTNAHLWCISEKK